MAYAVGVKMLKKFIALLLFLSILAFSGCTGFEYDEDELLIVTTLFPQYDFARAIVGDIGTVELLLTPGTDSHSFELTAGDISKIARSDLFVYTGPDMEIWVDTIINSLDESVDILNLSENVDLICDEHHDHHAHDGHSHGDCDPHIWTSPVVAMSMLKSIYDEICDIDPTHKEYFTENYNSYLQQLKSLDEEFVKIANATEGKKLYFSGKYAFAYFSREYGFDVVAPFDSCSSLQVEDFASVANLIKEMTANSVNYVFYEEFATMSVVNKIAEETNATPYLLHSGHNVSKDDFEKGITYIDILKQNANTLREALIYGEVA